jgi:hypothetical protein
MVGVPALEKWVCGTVLADRLAALELGKLADHRRAEPQRQEQGRQRGKDGAERLVVEQPEQALQLLQPSSQFIQHAGIPLLAPAAL